MFGRRPERRECARYRNRHPVTQRHIIGRRRLREDFGSNGYWTGRSDVPEAGQGYIAAARASTGRVMPARSFSSTEGGDTGSWTAVPAHASAPHRTRRWLLAKSSRLVLPSFYEFPRSGEIAPVSVFKSPLGHDPLPHILLSDLRISPG